MKNLKRKSFQTPNTVVFYFINRVTDPVCCIIDVCATFVHMGCEVFVHTQKMPKPKSNILLAMFDIRPKDALGRVDYGKISHLDYQINLLGHHIPEHIAVGVISKESVIKKPVATHVKDSLLVQKTITSPTKKTLSERGKLTQQLLARQKIAQQRDLVAREIEDSFQSIDVNTVLTQAGGKLYEVKEPKSIQEEHLEKYNAQIVNSPHVLSLGKSRIGEQANEEDSKYYEYVEPQISTDARFATEQSILENERSPAAQEIDAWLAMHDTHVGDQRVTAVSVQKRKKPRWGLRIVLSFSAVALLLFGMLVFQRGQALVTRSLANSGANAITNLAQAKKDLESLNFAAAADSFTLAHDDFNRASGTLDRMGASFISAFSSLPGFDKVQTASNLIEAGSNITQAGENLSLALATLSEKNYLEYLNGPSIIEREPITDVIKDFQEVLLYADRKIQRSEKLLSNIKEEHIPSDKLDLLVDFRSRIPQIRDYISGAIEYSDFALALIGEDEIKKYLILFQNNTERRPTGGFPGTYGLITFDNGQLKKVFIDDIYNIDGQIKRNIVPPLQLQHITPNWGVRDAAWYADFPLSAQKVQEFYEYDGGGKVDGVIAFTPHVVDRILGVVGPIEMPQYDLVLSRENFLAEIQDVVEVKADRIYPKQIVVDFQPKLFEKLASQDREQWVEIMKILVESIEERHVIAYFNDPKLQEAVVANKLSGEVLDTKGDYLQVVYANIKGSKTDAVTENKLELDTIVEKNGLTHTLSIQRKNNGGQTDYKFYNRTNSAYVQVFVPSGSELIDISGIDITNYKPLISYAKLGFEVDPELRKLEKSAKHPFPGVDVTEQFGKTVFGFWLNTPVQEAREVVIKYHIPGLDLHKNRYSLLWQKQSGTIADQINFGFKVPNGKKVINNSPNIQGLGSALIFKSDLTVDREIEIEFQ